jgi:outer membrane lipoprotein carrier protein
MNEKVFTQRYFFLTGILLLVAFVGWIPTLWADDPEGQLPISHDKQAQEQKDPELERIVAQLQATYQKIQTYRADFTQETNSKVLHNSRKSNGHVMFKKPGRMRWIYQNPHPQEVILQPDRIYIYLPKENQVMTRSIKDYLSGITPMKFLMGVGNLKEDFTISLVSGPLDNKDTYHLALTPKEKESLLKELKIWVNKKDFFIEQIETIDFLENWTRIRFSSQEINPDLPDSLFFFQIPKNAEILKDSL